MSNLVVKSPIPVTRPTRADKLFTTAETKRRATQVGNVEHEADLRNKGFMDPLVELGYAPDRQRTLKSGTYPPAMYFPRSGSKIVEDANDFREAEGAERDIEADTIMTTGIAAGSNKVQAHEIAHRGLQVLRERIPTDDFIKDYLPNADNLTQQVAREVLSGNEEPFVKMLDQGRPDDLALNAEFKSRLRDNFKLQDPRVQRALRNLEPAIMQAANDLLMEDGKPVSAIAKKRTGWLARLLGKK